MGGEGSGRRPDPTKRLLGFNQPAPTGNDSIYLPNLSGVKQEALKISSLGWTLNGANIFYNGDNVGIGTTIPATKLHISGGLLRIDSGTNFITATDAAGNSRFAVNYSTAGGVNRIRFQSTGIIDASHGTATYPDAIFIDETNGFVGMGQTIPATKLHVSGALDTSATIEESSTGDAALHYLLSGVRRWIIGIDNSDNDYFKIETGGVALGVGTNLLTLSSSGRISSGNVALSGAVNIISGGIYMNDTPVNQASVATTTSGALLISGGALWFRGITTATRLAIK